MDANQGYSERIEIPLSKGKIFLLLLGSIAFVLIGCLFISNPEGYTSLICRSPEIIRFSGILSVSFFGVCFVFIARKLFDNKPGLIIDEYGITDNSSATSVGLVEWADIKRIEKEQVASTRFLIIHTNKPKKYVERAKNLIARKAMLGNQKMYGSPLSVTSNALKISFEALEALMQREFERNR